MHDNAMRQSTTIGIGILSWRAHETLIQSLDSYATNGFLDMFDEKIIYFSDITNTDIEIARRYGWNYCGGPNAGIAAGMKRLGENMTSAHIVLLQNDNPICEDKEFTINHISAAQTLLDNGEADIVRLRHRWKVGEGFADVNKYLDYYPVKNVSPHFIVEEHSEDSARFVDSFKKRIKRILRPVKTRKLCGRSIFIEDAPQDIYPSVIKKINDFLIVDSCVLNFSDQCLMIKRSTWLDVFCAYVDAHQDSGRSSNGFPAPETSINGKWWRKSHFRIAQGRGVFTHARHDGSFRAGHRGFEKS